MWRFQIWNQYLSLTNGNCFVFYKGPVYLSLFSISIFSPLPLYNPGINLSSHFSVSISIFFLEERVSERETYLARIANVAQIVKITKIAKSFMVILAILSILFRFFFNIMNIEIEKEEERGKREWHQDLEREW